jgi:hypothetical protein
MRSILIAVLLSGVVLLMASSCATVPKEPLASGEVRLLSIDALGTSVEANVSFPVHIFFEAAGKPEIKRACFYESGEGPYCFDAPDISYSTFGTKRAFQVYLPALSAGSNMVECYAEYIRDGETRKTNVIATPISVGVAPGGP